MTCLSQFIHAKEFIKRPIKYRMNQIAFRERFLLYSALEVLCKEDSTLRIEASNPTYYRNQNEKNDPSLIATQKNLN